MKRRGCSKVLKKFLRCYADGGGVRQFLLWLRDVSAYEKRCSVREYRKWISRHEYRVPRGVEQSSTTTQVVSLAGTENGKVVWETDFLAEVLQESSSEFLLFTYDDVQLAANTPERFTQFAKKYGADVVYSDEDQVVGDCRVKPRFKPGFTIDLLFEEDYIGPVFLLRRSTASNVLDSILEGETSISSYALLLQLVEIGADFQNISEVLTHWQIPREVRLTEFENRSLREYLMRLYGAEMGIALVEPNCAQRENFDRRIKVSIIIPTKDRLDLLSNCIASIYRNSGGPDFEIIILDNGSSDADSLSWLKQAPATFDNMSVLRADYPFNWSRLNNDGFKAAGGDVLVFLNNDVEIQSKNWLSELSIHAMRPDVGVVGPLLVYPDGRIQHAGVVVGVGGFADHIYAGCAPDADDEHVFVNPMRSRNVLACTGACMVISRNKYLEVDGFDERLKICGDIDICIRLYQRGYVNRFDPHVTCYHFESATRLRAPLPVEEIEVSKETLGHYLENGDPFYNSNLALDMRYPSLPMY